MHLAGLHLAPVLAAEKSKVPFYIVGGLLVVWALVLSLGIGMRLPNFPGSLRGQRVVSAVSVALVAATLASAVLTSGGKATEHAPRLPNSTFNQGAGEPTQPAVVSARSGAALASASTTSASAATSTTTSTPAAPPAAKPAAKPKTSKPAARPKKASSAHPKRAAHKHAAPSAPASPSSTSLSIAANPAGSLEYTTKTLSAKAGKVTITMANMAPLEHNFTLASGGKVLGATPTFKGGTRSLSLTLKPGHYTFYCTVPGHRQAGMEGTLTVS